MSCSDFISDDVILTLAPLYRLGGLGVTVLPGLFKGATIVVTPETGPAEILDLIERHRVTVLFGAPALFQDLLAVVGERKPDLSSLRFCICGGDTIPDQLVRNWLALGVQFQQGYGLTEAAPLALLLDKHEMLTKNGAAGRSPFFTEVRVVHSDMADVQAGENGEIVVRGPNVMMGYWNEPEMTNATITDNGWLHTGDAARMDSDGHIYVTGRLKDAITSGNQTVFPSEIEKVLIKYPDVIDCAVTGIPVNGTNEITAFVVLSGDATNSVEQLRTYCERELPSEKVPRRFQLIDAIPRNPNGKILRRKLLELYTME
jgi:fatty-acyl-CoA synthase